jgi:hypothetical protein
VGKKVGGNRNSCRRRPVGYVFMVLGVRVPIYLYLGWNSHVILGQGAYMLIKYWRA